MAGAESQGVATTYFPKGMTVATKCADCRAPIVRGLAVSRVPPIRAGCEGQGRTVQGAAAGEACGRACGSGAVERHDHGHHEHEHVMTMTVRHEALLFRMEVKDPMALPP